MRIAVALAALASSSPRTGLSGAPFVGRPCRAYPRIERRPRSARALQVQISSVMPPPFRAAATGTATLIGGPTSIATGNSTIPMAARCSKRRTRPRGGLRTPLIESKTHHRLVICRRVARPANPRLGLKSRGRLVSRRPITMPHLPTNSLPRRSSLALPFLPGHAKAAPLPIPSGLTTHAGASQALPVVKVHRRYRYLGAPL